MPSSYLDGVLNSNKASPLDQLLARQQQHRLQTGRGNIKIGAPEAGNQLHDLQKQHSLPDSSSPASLPPLQGSVKPAPGAAELANKGPLFTATTENDSTMAPKILSIREMEALGKESGDKKSIWFKKEQWAKIVDQIKAVKTTNSELVTSVKNLSKDNKNLTIERDQLAADYEELEEAAQRVSSTRGRGKSTKKRNELKAEQQEDVNNQIKWFVKAVLFRTHKFVLPGKQLQGATKLVWEGIKNNMQLDKGPNALKVDDFVEIYGSSVLSELSARRQYHQGRCWKMAALEWLDAHNGTLPTITEIENVWNLPEAPPAPDDADTESEEDKHARENSPEYKAYSRAIKLLTWWMDSFMPMAVGLEFWGPNIRPFHLMTDKQFIDGDVSGKEKVLVTITSEAYAYQTYANCRDKWIADYAYLKEHGKKAKIPTYSKNDPSTHKHKNRWSNSQTGSVVGGGWDQEGLKYLQKKVKDVTAFRAQEEKDGFKRYKLAKELLQMANDVKMGAEQPESAGGKKRKRDDTPAEKANEAFEIIYIDE